MGQKIIFKLCWEPGLSSASRNHVTTFCRPFVHYACLRLCSTIVHFIRNNCLCFVYYGWTAQVLAALAPSTFISGGTCLPLLNFEFCLNIVSLSNTINIGSSVKVIRLMKNMLQNFGSILSILFLLNYLQFGRIS